MNNKIVHLDFDFDTERLKSQAFEEKGYEVFSDPWKKSDFSFSGWQLKHVTDGYGMEISNYIKEMFSLEECKPRFYIQEPGFTIPFHKDRGTTCSFNFILSEELDPIAFEDEEVYYRNALLNTQVKHAVLSPKNTRYLFKISVFDKSFEEIKNVLPSKLQIR